MRNNGKGNCWEIRRFRFYAGMPITSNYFWAVFLIYSAKVHMYLITTKSQALCYKRKIRLDNHFKYFYHWNSKTEAFDSSSWIFLKSPSSSSSLPPLSFFFSSLPSFPSSHPPLSSHYSHLLQEPARVWLCFLMS